MELRHLIQHIGRFAIEQPTMTPSLLEQIAVATPHSPVRRNF